MKKLLVCLIAACLGYGCAPLRAVRWWQPDLQDSAKFNRIKLQQAAQPFRFTKAVDQAKYQKLGGYLDTMLQNSNTSAFMVIKNDSIIYEYYAANINASSLHPSFSVAKSYIGTLVGIAVDQGMIRSTDDLVISYLPELAKNDKRFKRLTIQHVLDMRSGLDFNEDRANPFAGIAKLYYGTSLNNQIKHLKLKREPGIAFEYQSINTQLLANILERASGEKISVLFAKYLWQPLGAESDAIWSVDDQKTIKAFCCLNATVADFAKLGRLYLKKGNWQGQQLISEKWITGTTNGLAAQGYKNQWWGFNQNSYFKDSVSAVQAMEKLKLNGPIKKVSNGNYYFKVPVHDYRAEGILGQLVYVNPDNNVIIVRTGDYPNKNLYFNGFIPQIGREL